MMWRTFKIAHKQMRKVMPGSRNGSDALLEVGLALQEYCAVFRLFADLSLLVDIANATAGIGG